MDLFSTLRWKVIALFSGCGGLALGFKNVGFEIVAAFDNWDKALTVYKKNFPESQVFNYDLSKLNEDYDVFAQFSPYIIIGGPPCQDYSHAGKRDEKLGRADLTISFANIVAEIRPEWFVMENVDQIIRSQRLEIAKDMLRKAGYGFTEIMLNASLCGVPQIRKRYFLIGKLSAADGFLKEYLDTSLASRPMTVRDYLGSSLDIEHYYRHPRTYGRRAVFSIDEPSPTIRGVNRPIPKTYKRHPKDTVPISSNVRPLTTMERSLIQTFPKSFIFEGCKTDLEQMIGNAVPVKLAEYVAKIIIALEKKCEEEKKTRKRNIKLSLCESSCSL